MVKLLSKSKKGKKVVAKKGKKARVVVARAPSHALDMEAKKYMKLINDPCYAELVQPVYQSAGSGQLVRIENDFIIGAEATSVGAALIFTPGLITPSGAGAVIPTTVINSDTGAITWAENATYQCGTTFGLTAGAVRAVSACLQVSYVGSELTRAGVVSLAQMNRNQAIAFTTTAKLRSSAERVVRMPDGVLEIKLAPNAKNGDFASTVGATAADAGEWPSLVFTATGIPSSTGLRVRLVQVLEWVPTASTGVVSSTSSSKSFNSLQQVLASLYAANPQWQYDLLTGLGAYAAKAIAWL